MTDKKWRWNQQRVDTCRMRWQKIESLNVGQKERSDDELVITWKMLWSDGYYILCLSSSFLHGILFIWDPPMNLCDAAEVVSQPTIPFLTLFTNLIKQTTRLARLYVRRLVGEFVVLAPTDASSSPYEDSVWWIWLISNKVFVKIKLGIFWCDRDAPFIQSPTLLS